MNKRVAMLEIFIFASICVFVGYYTYFGLVPTALKFKPITANEFAGTIGWLFSISLFVERAVEVVIMVFRDQKSDLLTNQEAKAQQNLDNAIKNEVATVADSSAAAAQKVAASQATANATAALDAIHQQQVTYRAETKELALLVAIVFGALVSLAGVRALHAALPEEASGKLFTIVDIVITTTLLAGGSEGVHRIANAFTSFMDSISARADQAQKNLQSTTSR